MNFKGWPLSTSTNRGMGLLAEARGLSNLRAL